MLPLSSRVVETFKSDSQHNSCVCAAVEAPQWPAKSNGECMVGYRGIPKRYPGYPPPHPDLARSALRGQQEQLPLSAGMPACVKQPQVALWSHAGTASTSCVGAGNSESAPSHDTASSDQSASAVATNFDPNSVLQQMYDTESNLAADMVDDLGCAGAHTAGAATSRGQHSGGEAFGAGVAPSTATQGPTHCNPVPCTAYNMAVQPAVQQLNCTAVDTWGVPFHPPANLALHGKQSLVNHTTHPSCGQESINILRQQLCSLRKEARFLLKGVRHPGVASARTALALAHTCINMGLPVPTSVLLFHHPSL
jgi:hypothetical protein